MAAARAAAMPSIFQRIYQGSIASRIRSPPSTPPFFSKTRARDRKLMSTGPLLSRSFRRTPGSATFKHNFFQTLGNHAKRTLRHGVLFTSSMAGEEIHGRVQGFNNVSLDRLLPRPLLLTDDEAHEECGR